MLAVRYRPSDHLFGQWQTVRCRSRGSANVAIYHPERIRASEPFDQAKKRHMRSSQASHTITARRGSPGGMLNSSAFAIFMLISLRIDSRATRK